MVDEMRPSWPELMTDLAVDLSRRSTCARMKVGCVIASPDYRSIYAFGYNGNVRGGPNDCDRHGPDAVGSCGCIHAEVNAVINCGVPNFFEKVVFTTHLPCIMCAKALINMGGVKRVFYKNDYRIKDSLALFENVGIPIQLYDPT